MPRRVISRSRTGRSSEPPRRRRRSGSSFRIGRRDRDYDRDLDRDYDREPRDRRPDNREPRASGKKASPVAIVIIVVIVGALIGAAIWWGSKSTEDTRQAGPEAVTKAVVEALGTNSTATAKKYVAEGDSSTNTQVDNLFTNYADYFYIEDDYIKWEDMTYSITAQDDSSATVEVSGTAVIVEVDYIETWDDFEEDYVEEKIETAVVENDFSQAVFKLKKVGEEWYLDQVPSTIF